jgi:hypothetical protein
MKTIEPVSIWDNGSVKQAAILDAFAMNVSLGKSATFYYTLYSENIDKSINNQLASGNLIMQGEAYEQWTIDSYAWDWVAEQLNLTITGDYVPPVPPEPTLAREPEIESPAV